MLTIAGPPSGLIQANAHNNNQNGFYVLPGVPVTGSANITLTANQGYYVRFVCPETATYTKFLWMSGGASGSDDPVDVGVFLASDLSRVASSGATTGKLNVAANVIPSVTISAALTAGVTYYAGLSVGTIGGTAGQLRGLTFQSGVGQFATFFGTASPTTETAAASSQHPLPNPASGFGATGLAPFPLFVLRKS